MIYQEKYCENGQLIIACHPNTLTPELRKQYNCKGFLEFEFTASKFGTIGDFKLYHPNGQVAQQGKYEKTQYIFGKQRVGLWESFTPEGVKFYEAFYENGAKVWDKKY